MRGRVKGIFQGLLGMLCVSLALLSMPAGAAETKVFENSFGRVEVHPGSLGVGVPGVLPVPLTAGDEEDVAAAEDDGLRVLAECFAKETEPEAATVVPPKMDASWGKSAVSAGESGPGKARSMSCVSVASRTARGRP